MRRDSGQAGLQFIILLVFAAALLGGLVMILGAARGYEKRSLARDEALRRLEGFARSRIDYLEEDPSPEVDSQRDLDAIPLRGDHGELASVEDLSSAVNLNFAAEDLLSSEALRGFLSPSASAQGILSFRHRHGLSARPSHYAAFLGPGAAKVLGTYGWANANVADPDALVQVYLARTQDSLGAEDFRSRLAARNPLSPASGQSALMALLGAGADEVFPLINLEAGINLHFASPELLVAVLTQSGIKEPESRAQALVAARKDHDLSRAEVATILAVDGDHRVFQYLGLRTWFWRVKASLPGKRPLYSSLVVAALPTPGRSVGEKRRFAVVETEAGP